MFQCSYQIGRFHMTNGMTSNAKRFVVSQSICMCIQRKILFYCLCMATIETIYCKQKTNRPTLKSHKINITVELSSCRYCQTINTYINVWFFALYYTHTLSAVHFFFTFRCSFILFNFMRTID